MRTFPIDRWETPDPEPGVGGQEFYIRPGPFTLPDLEDAFKVMAAGVRDVVRFLPGRHVLGGPATRFRGGLVPGLETVPPGGPDGASKVIAGDEGHELEGVAPVGQGLAFPVIDLAAVRYWDAIGLNIVGSAFAGIRCQFSGGDEEHPTRVWGCTITNCVHANIQVQGWYKAPWGPSGWVDVAGNDITGGDIVRDAPAYNEGVYVCTGYDPKVGHEEWTDLTHHVTVRCNRISGVEAEPVEVKTGATDFVIEDNEIFDTALVEGGGDTSVPVASGIAVIYANTARPVRDLPVRGVVRRNRLWGLTQASGAPRPPILLGRGGVHCTSNIVWGCQAQAAIQIRGGAGGVGVGEIVVAHNTSDGQVLYNHAGYEDLTEYGNTPDQEVTSFVGPPDGTADVGWGPGSGYTPGDPVLPWDPGPLTDATGAPFIEPPPPGALNPD